MSYIALSGITGCISPVTGITSGFDTKYNTDKITTFYKKNVNIDFVDNYMVVIVFENYTQIFTFLNESDRNTFYNSI